MVRLELLRNQKTYRRGAAVDGNLMNFYIRTPLAFLVHQNVAFVCFDSTSVTLSTRKRLRENEIFGVAAKSPGGRGIVGGIVGWGQQRAAYNARTSTSAWKKAVGDFVRRAAQTDRVKERLFESAGQEQQKTLPLDCVVKNECRGGIWPVAWREGGANMAQSAPDQPPPLPESDRRWRGDDKEGGKQVESRPGELFMRAPGKGRGVKAYHEQGHHETVWRNRK